MTTGAHLLYSLLAAGALVMGAYCYDMSRSDDKPALMRFIATCFVAMALVLGMTYLQEAVMSALKSVSVEGVVS